MKCERCWIVERPLKGGKWKKLAAAFSYGAARNSCVPNFKDKITEGFIVTDIYPGDKSLQSHRICCNKADIFAGYCCKLPPRKPAKKGKK